jgi:hypothetical protein
MQGDNLDLLFWPHFNSIYVQYESVTPCGKWMVGDPGCLDEWLFFPQRLSIWLKLRWAEVHIYEEQQNKYAYGLGQANNGGIVPKTTMLCQMPKIGQL